MLKQTRSLILFVLAVALMAAAQAAPQAEYTPKFPGDPAHSDAEAAALGYMRTVVNAQRDYKKKHSEYATSLAELVGHVSFTRRMVKTDRGDYTVQFHGTATEFTLSLVPKQFDALHRAFFVDDSGTIRGEDDKPATAASPPVKRTE